MMRQVFQLSIVLVVAACASARTADPELRRRASVIEIVTAEEIADRDYQVISEVQGTSCAAGEGVTPTVDGARADMRIKAAERGGHAIVNVFCEELGPSFIPNCRGRVECRGDAIRWR